MSEPTTDPSASDGPVDPTGHQVDPAEGATSASFGAHPVVVYTLQRLVLLLVVGGVLYLVGLRSAALVVFAFLLSGVIAMVALKGSREGAAYGITRAVKKVNERIDESSRAEDYDDLDDDAVEPPAGAAPTAQAQAPSDDQRS